VTPRCKGRKDVIRVAREVFLRLVVPCASAAVTSGCVTRPTPSPRRDRPVSAIKLGQVLLRDKFDDPAAGLLERQSSAPDVEQGYRDGEYLLKLPPSFKDQLRATGPNIVFANVHVEVDVRLVAATETRWVAVACRFNIKEGNAVGAYLFAVSPATGWFALTRLEPDHRIVPLVPEQSSEAVRRGHASNHLELTCAGSTIIASINGIEVASARDGTHDSGYVAIIVSRSPLIELEARFDNLVIHEVLVEP
jgi:hypothetical protein